MRPLLFCLVLSIGCAHHQAPPPPPPVDPSAALAVFGALADLAGDQLHGPACVAVEAIASAAGASSAGLGTGRLEISVDVGHCGVIAATDAPPELSTWTAAAVSVARFALQDSDVPCTVRSWVDASLSFLALASAAVGPWLANPTGPLTVGPVAVAACTERS